MTQQTKIVIIGGGPAGLSCARILASAGLQVSLVERKPNPGPKVCAGGITWNGFLQHVPKELIQQAFPRQHIFTPWQHICVREQQPIIATVDREELGTWMTHQAKEAGAIIRTKTRALQIRQNEVIVEGTHGKQSISFDHLIGADGANSLVRRSLNLPTESVGIGLNAMLPLTCKDMEWHLCPKYFRHGYSWIFPYKNRISIGAYVENKTMPVQQLKQNLIHWAGERNIKIPEKNIRAGYINFDYQGHAFGNRWLIGEAAGLASGLTGEGIYPAIVSADAVARSILGSGTDITQFNSMIKQHKRHKKMLAIARDYPVLGNALINALVLMLRMRILDFSVLEMGR